MELSEAMEFVRLCQGRGVSFSLFREDMQDHRFVLRLEKLEGAIQWRDVVSIDGAVISQPEILEDHTWSKEVLDAGFDLVREVAGLLAREPLDELPRFLMQVGEGGVGNDAIEVFRDGTDI